MKTFEFQNEDPQTVQARLVSAAQQGDREAFGRLFEQFQRAVYAVAFRRLGNHAERRKSARKCSSRRCGRSVSSAIRAASPDGCARWLAACR